MGHLKGGYNAPKCQTYSAERHHNKILKLKLTLALASGFFLPTLPQDWILRQDARLGDAVFSWDTTVFVSLRLRKINGLCFFIFWRYFLEIILRSHCLPSLSFLAVAGKWEIPPSEVSHYKNHRRLMSPASGSLMYLSADCLQCGEMWGMSWGSATPPPFSNEFLSHSENCEIRVLFHSIVKITQRGWEWGD